MAYLEFLYHRDVFHFGFIEGEALEADPQAGPGLLVTTQPSALREIRGTNTPPMMLRFPTAQWIDAMTFSDEDIAGILSWAENAGYLRPATGWQTLVIEGDDYRAVTVGTREEAAALHGRSLEAEEAAAARGQGCCMDIEAHQITRRGMARLTAWPGDFHETVQAAILLYAKDVVLPKRPYVVGVWWSEPTSPEHGLAPTGTLLAERLHLFEVEQPDGEMVSLLDAAPALKLPEDPLVRMDL